MLNPYASLVVFPGSLKLVWATGGDTVAAQPLSSCWQEKGSMDLGDQTHDV